MELDFEDIIESDNPIGKLIHPNDLSNEEYHSLDGISPSGIKQAWKDPKLYAKRGELKRIPSPALTMGTALHEAILEPDSFSFSKYFLPDTNLEKLRVMIHNAKVMFSYITDKTTNEHSLIVEDNGFTRRIRMDAYDPILGIVYDLKSTRYNDPNK